MTSPFNCGLVSLAILFGLAPSLVASWQQERSSEENEEPPAYTIVRNDVFDSDSKYPMRRLYIIVEPATVSLSNLKNYTRLFRRHSLIRTG